jgi:cytoskeleton protein RodZ
VTDEGARQLDAFTTPGTLLKAAREAQGIAEREAADRLNLMPGYVAILERDDYQALRSPAFARGYVRAYGKLLGLDEEQLLDSFDQQRAGDQVLEQTQKRVETRPLQLQRTGLGVVIGLAVLLLLVLALWWWQGGQTQGAISPSAAPQSIQDQPVAPTATGEQ